MLVSRFTLTVALLFKSARARRVSGLPKALRRAWDAPKTSRPRALGRRDPKGRIPSSLCREPALRAWSRRRMPLRGPVRRADGECPRGADDGEPGLAGAGDHH